MLSMKKLGFILLLSLFSLGVYSQGVRMGVVASPQVSWLKSDVGSVKSDGSVMGFNFGLMSDFFFAERYSISTGLYINNTGGNLQYDSTGIQTSDGNINLPLESSIRYHLQYIEVPLVFHLESNKIGYFVYHAQFGLTNQIRIGATGDINSLDDTKDVDGVGIKEEIGLFNVGYNIGGGVNYYFSKNTALSLSLIYTNGFIDLTKESDDNVSLRSVALRIGIIF